MEKISNRQFLCIVILYVVANDLTRGIYVQDLGYDIWIPNVIGLIGSVILLSLYFLFYKNNKYESFESSFKRTLGKFFSKIVFIVYSIYFLVVAYFHFRDIIEAIQLILLQNMNLNLIGFVLLLGIIYILFKGIEVFGRISVIITIIMISQVIILSALLFTVNNIDFENFLPIMPNGFKEMIKPSIEMTTSLPYGELFVLLILYDYVDKKENSRKSATNGLLISGGILIYITLVNVIVIGKSALYYGISPSLRVVRLVDVEEYIQRIDVLLINMITIYSIFRISVLLFASTKLIKTSFNIKSKKVIYVVLIGLLFIALFFIGQNYSRLLLFKKQFFMIYINTIFEVFIPIIIILTSFIKLGKNQILEKDLLHYSI